MPADCQDCGIQIPEQPQRRGRPRKYCSSRCRGRHAHAGRRKPIPQTRCGHCGVLNPPPVRGGARRYCSTRCRETSEQRKARYLLACEFCTGAFWASKQGRRYCSLSCVTSHKNALMYADHEYVPRGKGHRGRAHRYGAVFESFRSESIFERDGWICRLCSTSVDRSLTWPHLMSASLDHIVPMSRGGDHVPGNTQCAHLRCNLVKGAKLDAGTASQALS